jgi:outer membrane protein assembly factor BamB
MDYETGESYITAFDYNGNHLWHLKGAPMHIVNVHVYISRISDISIKDNEIYLKTTTSKFNNIGSQYNGVFKIDALTGTVLWHTTLYEIGRNFDAKIAVTDNAVAVAGINWYFEYNGQMQQSTQTGVSKLFLIELDKTTGQQVNNYEWTSDVRYNILKAENNVPTAIVEDSYGNYIIGGAVGTRFYLNNNDSSVMILNYGMKDTDFWLGKFGNKDCVGNAIDNPADTALSVSAVSISEIKIYPNPAKNELFINFPAAENLNNLPVVEIFNIAGQRMLSTEYTNQQSINISTLQSGIYILKLGKYYGRFVKN